eukprot:6182032-Pleurochrysis_carterae.AAC.1
MFEGSNASSSAAASDFDSCDGAWAACSECDEPGANNFDGVQPDNAAGKAAGASASGHDGITGRYLGPAPSRIGQVTGVTDKRGHHITRTENTKQRLTHEEYAYRHLIMVTDNTIGRPCLQSCPFGRIRLGSYVPFTK